MRVKAKSIPFVAAVLGVLLAAGCVMAPPIPPGDPANPLKKVAVLPLRNDTNDVDGPAFVRQRLVEALNVRHYNIQPLEETDQLLRERLGISMGGQVELAQAAQLGESLGVQGLLYGVLMDFGETTTGVYNARKVRGRFKLINALDESVYWEGGLGIKTQQGHGGVAGDVTVLAAGASAAGEEVPWVIIDSHTDDQGILTGLAMGLGSKLISKAAGTHLQRETDEMIRRLFQTLPVGPGEGIMAAAAPPAAAAAAAPVPAMQMPMPSMGHMDFGDRDFTALMTVTTLDKKSDRTMSYKMPIAKAGKKMRMEMDYGEMAEGQEVPPAFRRVIMIFRGDTDVSYQLYPEKRKYIRSEETETDIEDDEPDIRRSKVGEEVVDGHPTEKYEIVVTYSEEAPEKGFVWDALDLDGMTIKSETENEAGRFTMLLRNIVLQTPDAALFEIPADYTEAAGFMEIVMDQQ